MNEQPRLRIVAYALAGVLVLVVLTRYFGDREAAPSQPPAEVALDEADARGGAADEPGASGELFVHVAGAVRKEGLYRVPAGSRVGGAVERAGGLERRAELSGVNLAAQVQDGQQIVVPERGAAAPPRATGASPGESSGSASSATSAAGGAPAAPISLASATPEQLDAGVEGIGPTLAARIVEFRDQNGGFRSIEQLREVDGIGEARFAALREAVSP